MHEPVMIPVCHSRDSEEIDRFVGGNVMYERYSFCIGISTASAVAMLGVMVDENNDKMDF